MKFIEIPTADRPQWLLWRHGGIGSSDAGAIMGVSKWKTRKQLLLEKATGYVGEDTSNQYIKNRGNKIEGFVREFIEKEHKQKYPPLSGYNETFPFMKVSLDGITVDRKIIVEIKLLSSQKPDKVNVEAEGYIKWDRVRSKGEVPLEYYPQIQHQLLVTGANECLFVGYKEIRGDYAMSNDKLAYTSVLPNREYITRLAEEEFKFWFEVEQMKKELKYGGELE